MEEVHVPHDVLLNHILPRVPPKSIGRFRCVSKEWHSLLTSKMFKIMYIDHHQNNIKLLLFPKPETSSFEFTTIDCEALPSDKGLTPTRRPLPQFGYTKPYRIHILTSFHGLVCLGIQKNKHAQNYCDLILWNPLTNEYKRLSKSSTHRDCNSTKTCSRFGLYFNMRCNMSKFELYYSCCEDDYKLLSVDYIVYIYSLKSDSWRKVDTVQSTNMLDTSRWSRGTYLNENLYFLQDQWYHYNNGPLSSIIKFDTKTEQFSKIEIQNVVDDIPKGSNYFATIVVKSDCIHVCIKYTVGISFDNGYDGRRTCIKLWKLDEFGNMKQVLTYQLKPRHFSSLRASYLMKNGNWLMMKNWWSSSYIHKIYKVDLIKNKHVEGNIYDDHDDFEYAEVIVDGKNNIFLEQGRYVETFVSPNRYRSSRN